MRPLPTRSCAPLAMDTPFSVNVALALPYESATNAGMSPSWCGADCGPCGLPSGLKCPPVLMPVSELQSPFSWPWKPCSAPGFKPVRFALTRTLSPSCVNVTVPRALLPVVGSRFATAEGSPPMPMEAHPAAMAAGAPTANMRFMRALPWSFLRIFLLVLLRVRLGLLLRFRGVGLGRHRSALRRLGLRDDRHRLRDGLAHLLHVALVVLHRAVLGGGLVGLRFLGGGRVLRLLLLGGGLALLVERRRRRDLRPRGTHGERHDHGNGMHRLHDQSSPGAGCAPAGAMMRSGRLPCFTSSYHSRWCSRAHSSST